MSMHLSLGATHLPPDEVLPDDLHELAGEFRHHKQEWVTAKQDCATLADPKRIRRADLADAELLGDAVRAGEDLPGTPNMDALVKATETAEAKRQSHEAAARSAYGELFPQFEQAAAERQQAARAMVDAACTESVDALTTLRDARATMLNAGRAAAYWGGIPTGRTTTWPGQAHDPTGEVTLNIGGRSIRLGRGIAEAIAATERDLAKLTAALDPLPDVEDQAA
jgi:hypothetical protein